MLSAGRSWAAFYRRRFFPTAHEKNVRAWFELNGDATLRLEYPLTPASTVLDVGGFEGQWANDIFESYGCSVAIFEPWPAFARQIEQRFRDNPALTVHPYGLGGRSRCERVYSQGDSTSVFQRKESAESAELPIRAVTDVWEELDLDFVELMKVNIEGGEYELLDALIDSRLVCRIRDIQVQFHDVVPDAEDRVRELRERLEDTHKVTYSIPFVWENWTLLAAKSG